MSAIALGQAQNTLEKMRKPDKRPDISSKARCMLLFETKQLEQEILNPLTLKPRSTLNPRSDSQILEKKAS